MTRPLRTTLRAGVTGGIIAAGLALLAPAPPAAAIPNCGGQGASPKPVPYTCNLPGKTIDGTHFSATVFADGTKVVVNYHLATPRQVPTPIRITHHEGVSGGGLASDQSRGTIPAGQTEATLVDSSPCRDGQLDVKAVFVGPGDGRGRVGGPWIRNGTDCQTGTTVPPTTAPASSVPPSSTPGGSVPPGPGPSTPPPSGQPRTPGTGGSLPATGPTLEGILAAAAVALLAGVAIVAAMRRHEKNRARSERTAATPDLVT